MSNFRFSTTKLDLGALKSPGSPTKTKTKPSFYSAKTFHGVRTILAISALIVTGILIFFCVALKNDGYKIPWTFLIVGSSTKPITIVLTSHQILLTTVLTILCLLLTLVIHLCFHLSPLFNLILNVPLLVAWIASLGLLAWNIYGTLAHSCSTSNWGNSDGVNVCQLYKTVFAFGIFGTISQIAMVVVDVRARMAQTRSGRYAKMHDSTSQMKLEPYDTTHANVDTAHSQSNSVHDLPYTDASQQYRDQEEVGWRPGQRTNTAASSHYSGREQNDYGDLGGRDGRQQVMMNQFGHDQYHNNAPMQRTGYDSGYQSQQFVHRY